MANRGLIPKIGVGPAKLDLAFASGHFGRGMGFRRLRGGGGCYYKKEQRKSQHSRAVVSLAAGASSPSFDLRERDARENRPEACPAMQIKNLRPDHGTRRAR